MFRIVLSCCLLILCFGSAGCRMCCTPHDNRIAGFIDRCGDYRGFNPDYRAGSVFGDNKCGTFSADIQDAHYRGSDHGSYHGSPGDVYSNAGNYGETTPVTNVPRSSDSIFPHTRSGGQTIGIPDVSPDKWLPKTIHGDVPDIRSIFREPTDLPPMQIDTPTPERLRLAPPLPDAPIPFTPITPNDEIVIPPRTFPTIQETELPITLEELRRLDPSVHDIQIISIEDAAIETRRR